MCCSVLQVMSIVRCSVLQCVVVCCSVLQNLQCVAHVLEAWAVSHAFSVLQCVALCCSVLQCVSVRCSVLKCAVGSLTCSRGVGYESSLALPLPLPLPLPLSLPLPLYLSLPLSYCPSLSLSLVLSLLILPPRPLSPALFPLSLSLSRPPLHLSPVFVLFFMKI